MINWLVFCSFVFSMAMTLLGLLVDLTYQIQYEPRLRELHIGQHRQVDSFLEADDSYRTHPIFQAHAPEKKDLGSLILKLQGGDLQRPLITVDVKKNIFALGKDWPKQKHKIPKLETVDHLFTDIDDFDHWKIPLNTSHNLATDLIVAGQVLLAWHFHHQPEQLESALKKTRRMSLILLRTEDLNFKKAGLSLLEKESELIDFIQSRFHSNKTEISWRPVPPRELTRFRKHLGQGASFLTPVSAPSVLEKIFLETRLPMGFCSFFKRKEPVIIWSVSYLKPRFPFEPSFVENLEKIERIESKARQHCQPWEFASSPDQFWFRHIPYYRRIYGIKMILNAEKNLKVL